MSDFLYGKREIDQPESRPYLFPLRYIPPQFVQGTPHWRLYILARAGTA